MRFKRGGMRVPHSIIQRHIISRISGKLTAKPAVEFEIRKSRERIAWRKCDLTESYPRLAIGIKIDAHKFHFLGNGFRDADHILEIVRPSVLDWRVSVGNRHALPIPGVKR